MKKSIKTKKAPVAQELPVDARTVWLAGLGAVSLAKQRGGALFDDLVAEGRAFQARSRKFVTEISADARAQANGLIAPLRERATAGLRRSQSRVERGTGRILNWIGVPSRADVSALTQRIDTLSRQLRAAK